MLERLQLPAFDLCKVLEAFVQQLPTLHRCVCGGGFLLLLGMPLTDSPRFPSHVLLPGPCWPAWLPAYLTAWLRAHLSARPHTVLTCFFSAGT